MDRYFRIDSPTVARRAFRANGRAFKPGDIFPWQQMAISVRKARQLFDSGLIAQPTGMAEDAAPPQPIEIEETPTVDLSKVKVDLPEENPAPLKGKDEAVFEAPELVSELSRNRMYKVADHYGLEKKRDKNEMREVIVDHFGPEYLVSDLDVDVTGTY